MRGASGHREVAVSETKVGTDRGVENAETVVEDAGGAALIEDTADQNQPGGVDPPESGGLLGECHFLLSFRGKILIQ